jgi:hypothetical protein
VHVPVDEARHHSQAGGIDDGRNFAQWYGKVDGFFSHPEDSTPADEQVLRSERFGRVDVGVSDQN